MPLPGAIVADFDGTACLHDVGVCLADEFGDPNWRSLGEAYDRGELSYRELLTAENAMLRGTREEMTAFVLSHCPMDPTFAPFVRWAGEQGITVTLASDGSGFHIAPMLAAAGLSNVNVRTNHHLFDAEGFHAGLAFPSGHPECVGCGTCKMKAVLDARTAGRVVFIGDGVSDRYGVLYADLVFAKHALPAYCEEHGVPYLWWNDFDDVRRSLLADGSLPGPVAPERCPGWVTS